MAKSHYAKLASSPRLQRTLAALAPGHHLSSFQLATLTRSVAIHSNVHELRQNGFDIACKRGKRKDTGEYVFEYWLVGDSVRRAKLACAT